jgi:hypothetical protein
VYFGVFRRSHVAGTILIVILTLLLFATAPNRWGVGIALHYLSRRYFPDPEDPIPGQVS